MRKIFLLLLLAVFCQAVWAENAAKPKKKPTSTEEKRKRELINRLAKDFSREKLNEIFSDPRLKLRTPPPPTPSEPTVPQKKPKGNPYLSERFGLLTDESLERCKIFYNQHSETFDLTEKEYPVPKEIICGILRIETNFGIPTAKTLHPFGIAPAINNLVSMYVRKSTHGRREFAARELLHLINIADRLQRDIFDIPGSSTGAIGFLQCQPSTCNMIGKIDPFNPDDAIMAVRRYLVMLGFDEDLKHQARAIELYYGIPKHKKTKGHIYYREAVQKYAAGAKKYIEDHPI